VEAEIRGVLARRKFSRALTDGDRNAILALIMDAAFWVEPTLKVNDCRDAKDNKYLELAATTGAEIIISSDDDLLVLDPWHGTRIIRPTRFLGMP
jgi:putative PIN family toxin of toxin-antitoxin system